MKWAPGKESGMIGSRTIGIVAVLVAMGSYSLGAKSGQAAETGDPSLVEKPGIPSDAAQGSEAGPSVPRSPLRLSTIDYQDTAEGSGKLTLAGIALPGRELYLFLDDEPLAEVQPDESGNWSFEKEMRLDDGRHTFRADQYDKDTQMVAARAIVSLQRAKQENAAPAQSPAPKAETH
jgi:hypothetical protein